MKRRFLHIAAIAFFSFCFVVVFAEKNTTPQNNTNADKIESLLFAFITEKLNLTPLEAKKFQPVYMAYRKDFKNIQSQYPVGVPLTAEQQIKLEQQKLDLKEKYIPQLKIALGAEKLNHLYSVERQFQEKLQQIRAQRMQQNSNNILRPGAKR